MPISANQVWEEFMDVKKGWFAPAALDIVASLATSVTIRVPRGAVMHLNAAGQFELGVTGTQMAIFALQASDDPDVSIPGTTSKGNFVSQSILPSGRQMSGLVATGAYEIASTAYDSTKVYAPNQLLTASTGIIAGQSGLLANDLAGAGVPGVGPVVPGTTAACGVVSRGVITDEWGVNRLHFWPVYLPA